MPRYSSLQIRDVKVLTENVQTVFSDYSFYNFKNQDSQELSNDIRLNWDGSIDFDEYEQDIRLVYNLEAFVQRVYFWLITSIGELPHNEFFGWNLNKYIGETRKVNTNELLREIKKLESLEDVEYVNDIVVEEVEENATRYLSIEIDVKPKFFKYRIFLNLIFS
jgi:hypothetical protein